MDYKSYAADKAKANKEAHKAKQKNGKLNKSIEINCQYLYTVDSCIYWSWINWWYCSSTGVT